MRILLVFPCLLAMLLCGCPSGFTGIYDAPVFWLGVNEAEVPEGTLTDGDPAQFVITWHDGRPPYQVSWNFGNGATPNTPGNTVTEGMTSSVTVNLVNTTDAPVEYDGYVTITDEADDSQSATFSFTVNPAG